MYYFAQWLSYKLLIVLEPALLLGVLEHLGDRFTLSLDEIRVPEVEQQQHAVSLLAIMPHLVVKRI
jgi:hypothetical protein